MTLQYIYGIKKNLNRLNFSVSIIFLEIRKHKGRKISYTNFVILWIIYKQPICKAKYFPKKILFRDGKALFEKTKNNSLILFLLEIFNIF